MVGKSTYCGDELWEQRQRLKTREMYWWPNCRLDTNEDGDCKLEVEEYEKSGENLCRKSSENDFTEGVTVNFIRCDSVEELQRSVC